MEQLIDKAALVAEINKRIMDAPINNIGHQRVWAYNDVKDILNTLEVKEVDEEPVSEDLEEAAIEICSKVLKEETITIDGYEYVVLSDAEECFKAGADWQKRRIVKEIAKVED